MIKDPKPVDKQLSKECLSFWRTKAKSKMPYLDLILNPQQIKWTWNKNCKKLYLKIYSHNVLKLKALRKHTAVQRKT